MSEPEQCPICGGNHVLFEQPCVGSEIILDAIRDALAIMEKRLTPPRPLEAKQSFQGESSDE